MEGPAGKMSLTLGYWDIRGLAHAIRLLLEYAETPYEDKRYHFGEAPDFDRREWTSVKEKLGFDFPNLPYLIDGDRKLTQSNAILRYLARKHKMCGETEEEIIRMDILEYQVVDFATDLATVCYSPDFITYVDFLAYDILDLHQMFQPKCLDQFKNLKDFLDRFEALEKISAYMKSSRFLRTPLYGRNATWGNTNEYIPA